jgi:hypothetical protein
MGHGLASEEGVSYTVVEIQFQAYLNHIVFQLCHVASQIGTKLFNKIQSYATFPY